jgi:hypothetical protein
MHLLITGAAGFPGRALAKRLTPGGLLGGRTVTRLPLLELALVSQAPKHVRHCEGDMGDADWLPSPMEHGFSGDALFHLGSNPGGTAELGCPLSRRVNLGATQTPLEHGRQQVAAGHGAPVFEFVSSIAVVDDDTPTDPQMPTVARKASASCRSKTLVGAAGSMVGLCSFRKCCRTRPRARASSRPISVALFANWRRAAHPPVPPHPAPPPGRPHFPALSNSSYMRLHSTCWPAGGRWMLTLPTLHFAIDDLVRAVGHVQGVPAADLMQWAPDGRIETLYVRCPPLLMPCSEAAGFRADADLAALARQALPPD